MFCVTSCIFSQPHMAQGNTDKARDDGKTLHLGQEGSGAAAKLGAPMEMTTSRGENCAVYTLIRIYDRECRTYCGSLLNDARRSLALVHAPSTHQRSWLPQFGMRFPLDGMCEEAKWRMANHRRLSSIMVHRSVGMRHRL